jgi:hypothetical protein
MASGRTGSTGGAPSRSPQSPDGKGPNEPEGPDNGEQGVVEQPIRNVAGIDHSVPSVIESGPIQLEEVVSATNATIAVPIQRPTQTNVQATNYQAESSSRRDIRDRSNEAQSAAPLATAPPERLAEVEPLAPAKRVAKESTQQQRGTRGEADQQTTYTRFDPPASTQADEAPRLVIQPEISYTPKALTVVRRWNRIPVLICTVVGVLIAIGLYAGGGDILGKIFSNQNEGITPVNPAAITERPRPIVEAGMPQTAISQPDNSVTSGQAMTSTAGDAALPGAIETASQAPVIAESNRNTTAEPRDQYLSTSAGDNNEISPTGVQRTVPTQAVTTIATRPDKPVEKVPVEKIAAEKKIKEARETAPKQPVIEKRAKNLEDVAPQKVKAKEVAGNTIYNIQVRATTDQSEANLIARRLKRKGFGNVTIVQSEKNGAPFFKVRFGSFSSKDEAKQAANGSGYTGTWVLKQQ